MKRYKMKSFCSLILAFVLFCSTGFLPAFAADGVAPNGIAPEDMQDLLEKWNSILEPETPFTDLDFFLSPEAYDADTYNDILLMPAETLYISEMNDEEIELAFQRLLNGENIVLRDEPEAFVGITPMWSAGSSAQTHQWITTWALNYLYSCSVLFSYNDRLSATERGYLVSYSDWPDSYETVNTNDWHFYNYLTKMNYWNNLNSNENAKTRFTFWYSQAVSFYRIGQTALAFQNLGKAIHYLSDLNAPPHTGDRDIGPTGDAAQFLRHVGFESSANKDRDVVRLMPTYINLSKYESSSTNTIADQAAAFSFQYYHFVQNGTAADYYKAYSPTINSSIVDVMGVLYKFWCDTDGLSRH